VASRTMTTYLQKDLDLCAGEPDGELIFIDLIGFDVPSYIDPRYDLVVPGQVKGRPHLNHHVPFKLRGPFKHNDLPDSDLWKHETNEEDLCVCSGKRKDGLPCRAPAYNRSEFCGNHGGALHPADRQIKNLGDGIVPDASKVRKLDRAQKVSMGLIKVEDLSDVEIHGMYVINDDGKRVSTRKLSDKIHQDYRKELMIRMEDFLVTSLPDMLKVMVDIANDPIVEAADRIKAATWASERVIGKNPEIVIHGKMDKPYEQIITRVESGSREEYRRALESSNIIEGEIVEDGNHRPAGNSDGGDGIPVRTGTPGTVDGALPDRHGSDSGLAQSDEEGSSLERVSPVTRQQKLKRLRDEQRIARNKRYAARAYGATNTEDLPFTLEFKARKDGTFNVRFWPAEDLTPEIVDRIQTAEALAQITQASA
jgi:hypothetical protein